MQHKKQKRSIPPGDRALHQARVERFQIACEALKTSPTATMRALGASESTWSQYLNRSANPDWRWWRPACERLGINEDWLLNGRGPMTKAEAEKLKMLGQAQRGAVLPELDASGRVTDRATAIPEGCAVMRLGNGDAFIVAEAGRKPSAGEMVLLRSGVDHLLRRVISISQRNGALIVEDPDAEAPTPEAVLPSEIGAVRVVLGELY